MVQKVFPSFIAAQQHLVSWGRTDTLETKTSGTRKGWTVETHQWCTVPPWPWWWPRWSDWHRQRSPGFCRSKLRLVRSRSGHLALSTPWIWWHNATRSLEDKCCMWCTNCKHVTRTYWWFCCCCFSLRITEWERKRALSWSSWSLLILLNVFAHRFLFLCKVNSFYIVTACSS